MMLLQVAAETAGITAQTWFITGLGFGMVVALLALFVYVMELLGWIM